MVETTYTFFLRDETSAPPAFEIDMLEGPAAARVRALELLQDRRVTRRSKFRMR